MATSRIQKLLFSEYSDFEDIILVESPFAETSKYGRGVRQVQLGLTPTKLILASYNIEPADNLDTAVGREGRLDPDIESFELISAYPVECVNLSVFRKSKRRTLKARFCNGKVLYLELGGWLERNLMWEAWCDRVKFLSPAELSSTVSETSMSTATSSNSTLYIRRSSLSVTKSGRSQLWCQYSRSNTSLSTPELVLPCPPDIRSSSELISKQVLSFKTNGTSDSETATYEQRMWRLADEGVSIWERKVKSKRVHARRYAFTPKPHFMYGLGCCPLSSGDVFSLQVKRVLSCVNVSCEPQDETLLLPLPRQLLKASVSCDNVPRYSCVSGDWTEHYKKRPSVLFWTPGYQYRPRSTTAAYRLVQNHLRSFKGDPLISHTGETEEGYWQIWDVHKKDVIQVNRLGKSMCSGDTALSCRYPFYAPIQKQIGLYGYLSQETVCLHQALTLTLDVTLWDFNSIVLSHQLTMIDRHLLLKVARDELGTLLRHKCVQNAPNILALVSFSHRISCLVATHIVKCVTVKNRARIIIKFVKMASYCDVLRNMQAAKNIMCGLQCPAVYRLHETWTYVRKHYYTKYCIFVDLCYRYKDPRLAMFQKTYSSHTVSPPSIPCIAHIITLFLNKMPTSHRKCSRCAIADNVYKWKTDIPDGKAELPRSLRRFLSAVHVYHSPAGLPVLCDSTLSGCCESGNFGCSCGEDTGPFEERSKSNSTTHVLENVEKFLTSSQEAALNYGFKTNFLAKEFLLKAQYKEDKDNFFLSLKTENNAFDTRSNI